MNCGMQNNLRFPASALMGCSDPHFGRCTWILLYYYMHSITIKAWYRQLVLIRSHLPAARWPRRVGPYLVIRNRSCTDGMTRLSNVSTTKEAENQCCDIFISQDHINTGWTLGLCSNQTWTRPVILSIYRSQLPKNQHHEVLCCIHCLPLRSLLPGSRCQLCVLLSPFATLRITLTTYIFRWWARCTSMLICGHEIS